MGGTWHILQKGEVHRGLWWGHCRIERLGGPRHRCGDNIKIDFIAIGYENVDWIDLVQDRLLCIQ